MPGFGPAAEPLLFRQKDPKPLTPRLAHQSGGTPTLRRAAQLAGLRHGPLDAKSVPPVGQPAGVRLQKTNRSGLQNFSCCLLKEKGSIRYYQKRGHDKLIRVDYHGKKEVPSGTCHAILKAARIKQ